MLAAWLKASPTSRSVTSRNGGGRSSAGLDDRCGRCSVGIRVPGLAIVVWNTYNVIRTGARAGPEQAVFPSPLRGTPRCAGCGPCEAGDEMAERPPSILICSCEDTMPLDGAAVKRGCRGAEVLTAHQLCRAELEKFRAAVAGGEQLIVGCTQETTVLSAVAGDAAVTNDNSHETAM